MEILSILNKYKDTLKELINSSDVKHLAIPRQINLPHNNIPDSKDDSSDHKIVDDLLDSL